MINFARKKYIKKIDKSLLITKFVSSFIVHVSIISTPMFAIDFDRTEAKKKQWHFMRNGALYFINTKKKKHEIRFQVI